MKKLSYLFVAAALCAACSGNKAGYTVVGTVEGAADGDTVYLAKAEGRQLVNVDTAVIADGKFIFEGEQPNAEVRYITYFGEEPLRIDFFLENGNINITLGKESDDVAAGTATNDAYQAYRTASSALNKQQMDIYKAVMTDETLTDEQKADKMKEVEALGEQLAKQTKDFIAANITNPAGIHLLKGNYYQMTLEELEPLMSQISAAYDNDERIQRIKENVEMQKKTAVGQKFTDFAMKTPEGKDVKLSDYVGKGKVVLVDFWASWCGPCRREMPNLVEAYAKYKNKGFEIVGVSLDREGEAGLEAWKKAIKDLNITWPQMSDLKFWDCEGAKLYAVSSIPSVVLIDGEGTIIARGLHGEELQEKLAEVLK